MLCRPEVKIGGNNRIVKAGESLFTRRKSNVGRLLPPQWDFGGLCRETKECYLVAISDRSAKTLLSGTGKNVADGSTIFFSGC
ncbi:hypothetical protein X975_12845, partial [Stegodyphus mimosarum]